MTFSTSRYYQSQVSSRPLSTKPFADMSSFSTRVLGSPSDVLAQLKHITTEFSTTCVFDDDSRIGGYLDSSALTRYCQSEQDGIQLTRVSITERKWRSTQSAVPQSGDASLAFMSLPVTAS